DLFQSGFLQRHFNVRAVSVDAVFNEFFDDGSGTFDDFASGYFIRQRFGQLMNFHRSSIPFSRSSFKSFSMFNASSGVISLMLSDFIFSMALASASVDGLFFRSSSTIKKDSWPLSVNTGVYESRLPFSSSFKI